MMDRESGKIDNDEIAILKQNDRVSAGLQNKSGS